MPCYSPVGCVMGKSGPEFRPAKRGSGEIYSALPCGGCTGCRLDKAQAWKLRCANEALMHKQNCWMTLTYDPEHLPHGGTLVKEHHQKFIRALRDQGAKFSYYGCGEYGENLGRPHYHICVFGWEPKEVKLIRHGDEGGMFYTSEEIAKAWGKGIHEVTYLTPAMAGYTARYTGKKVTGKKAEAHYTRLLEDGTFVELEPEYQFQSTRPGIGKSYYEKYKKEIYRDDFIVLEGTRIKPPAYYDKLLEREDPKLHAKIKTARRDYAESHQEDETLQRRKTREAVKKAQIGQLKRPMK